MTDDSYFNISQIKLSITSLFSVQIMSYLEASDIIYSDVIDSFISEILKYKFWIFAYWRKRSWAMRFTSIFPFQFDFEIAPVYLKVLRVQVARFAFERPYLLSLLEGHITNQASTKSESAYIS